MGAAGVTLLTPGSNMNGRVCSIMPIVNSSIDRRRFALTLAGTAALSTARGEESGAAKLWTEVPHWMELACLPGAVVAVIEKGSVAGVHAFGVRRDGEAGAVDAATIFEAASLSKPVFASAVLRLTAAKALDLDRPLDEILPLAADPRAKLITARHVLSHSSGLQNWRNPRNDKFEFSFPPGEKFSYSGDGYFYLQRAVEKITTRPFAHYMRETVLEPLGMTRSSCLWRGDADVDAPQRVLRPPVEAG